MLSVFILLPFLGITLIFLLPTPLATQARTVALSILGALLLWSAVILTQFDASLAGFQLEEGFSWLEGLGLSYRLSVDGLSLPLLILNGLLTLVAVYCSAPEIHRPKLYYSMLLLIYTGVAGAFLADNTILFFLFYELELIPLYLLIAIWGGTRRSYAATKFLIYTAVSGILILAGFLGLGWLSGSSSFNYEAGLGSSLPLGPQFILLTTLLVGFAIKLPLVPFHTWLPDAHVEASTPVSILLAGVLLKLGTYGLLRYCLGLFPEAWAIAAPALATWSVISVLYGSVNAIAQTDMKKMVAYSSIGHMGFVLLACAANTSISLLGTLFQMVSHGMISALMFLLVGVVYTKTGTRDLRVLRGLLNPECGLPIVGTLMIVGVMASAGLPGMMGFVSEFLVFRGSFGNFPIQTLLCMVGTAFTSVYFLLLVNRALFGRLAIEPGVEPGKQDFVLPPVHWKEYVPGLALAGVIIWGGLQPNLILQMSEATLENFIVSPSLELAQLTPEAHSALVP
ncbi:NADH-quinone oxidoreductase subunit M [Lyngbya confervoides]|uniref:NADH-quinone oxidoreductase subunit M n=1 Tax=Lyngbya confervoides BDU141951 TaxID=1574623 RepID=A0ABD4T404_9CYAN|nr:NADH-quinone oxidoreductase subunit M [Lyngbya confervoides]MCM1983050.1 NADH-quinone oxidoreductase subunit M [Lyngbya confervoides BDU141951]